mgnify:CR=1 FL=1
MAFAVASDDACQQMAVHAAAACVVKSMWVIRGLRLSLAHQWGRGVLPISVRRWTDGRGWAALAAGEKAGRAANQTRGLRKYVG